MMKKNIMVVMMMMMVMMTLIMKTYVNELVMVVLTVM